MKAGVEKFRKDLNDLINEGNEMLQDLMYQSLNNKREITKEQKEEWKKLKYVFRNYFQKWYSKSLILIKQLMHERYQEFVDLYQPDPKRKEINFVTYKIQDWLNGKGSSSNRYTGEKNFDDFGIVVMNFQTQLGIIESIESRFENSLLDIKNILQADLHDNELDAARELLKNGYDRAAGMIAGVTIEGHLKSVCEKRGLKISKQNPTISDLNDTLKKADVLDIPNWRFIQRLADLRNLCGHKRERDPSTEEVTELIDGADKVIKTVF